MASLWMCVCVACQKPESILNQPAKSTRAEALPGFGQPHREGFYFYPCPPELKPRWSPAYRPFRAATDEAASLNRYDNVGAAVTIKAFVSGGRPGRRHGEIPVRVHLNKASFAGWMQVDGVLSPTQIEISTRPAITVGFSGFLRIKQWPMVCLS